MNVDVLTQDEMIRHRENLEVALDGELKEDLEILIAYIDGQKHVLRFLLELLPHKDGEPVSIDAAQYMTLLRKERS